MTKIDLNVFGNRLKYLMFERGVTSKTLSKMVGIGQNTMSFYITCQRVPSIDVFMRIARALELSDDEIIGLLKLV